MMKRLSLELGEKTLPWRLTMLTWLGKDVKIKVATDYSKLALSKHFANIFSTIFQTKLFHHSHRNFH